jgi:5-methylcytosine-specific restriction endonuclease McrA
MPVLQPCLEPDCPELIPVGKGPRCPACTRARAKQRKARFAAGLTGTRPNRPGWSRLRARVLRRDGHRCQTPGCTNTAALQVHHLDGDAHNDRLDNLVVLCARCHRERHATASGPHTGSELPPLAMP